MIRLPYSQNDSENEIRKFIESYWNTTCTQEILNKSELLSDKCSSTIMYWQTMWRAYEKKKSVFSNHIGDGNTKNSINTCVGGVNQVNKYFIF